MGKSKKIAQYALLVSLALILSYVESLIPSFAAVPGFRIGLANLVVITALYHFGYKEALIINIVRIILVLLLFGNTTAFFYSLAGAVFSFFIMAFLKKCGIFKIATVSICGAVSHNIGQILVAMVLTGTKSIAWYLAILWFTGIFSGAIIGFLGAIIVKRIEKIQK